MFGGFLMIVGLMSGVIFFFFAGIIALWFYSLISPLYRIPTCVIGLSLIGHYLGAYAYGKSPHDSLMFFYDASPVFTGFGTDFVRNIAWIMRAYIVGDSYFSALFLSGAIAFLGSVLWFCLYAQAMKILKLDYWRYWLPALVIMCWPSYLYFTTGIGKDSLCFTLIPASLLAWTHLFYLHRHRFVMFMILFGSLLLLTMIRPYLLIVFGAAAYFSTWRGIRHLSIWRVLSFIILAPAMFFIVQWAAQQMLTNLNVADVTQVANVATMHQTIQSKGTFFPMLSYNPMIVLLSLPYSMFMNLVMPLFFLAHNMTAYLASVQNAVLVLIILFCIKNRAWFVVLRCQYHILKFYFYFFLAGLAILGLTNTNLGAAVRHKTMYVPILLIIAMCIWVARKRRA